MKNIEDMAFGELVEYETQQIHSDLLVGGGGKMREAVYHALVTAMNWNAAQVKKEKEAKKEAKKHVRNCKKN